MAPLPDNAESPLPQRVRAKARPRKIAQMHGDVVYETLSLHVSRASHVSAEARQPQRGEVHKEDATCAVVGEVKPRETEGVVQTFVVADASKRGFFPDLDPALR